MIWLEDLRALTFVGCTKDPVLDPLFIYFTLPITTNYDFEIFTVCYTKIWIWNYFISRKNNICNASRKALSIFDPLFANIMNGMNRKLDEKFGKMSFDESVAIYDRITDGSESDFVNMLMAQNKDINKTEVCLTVLSCVVFGHIWQISWTRSGHEII